MTLPGDIKEFNGRKLVYDGEDWYKLGPGEWCGTLGGWRQHYCTCSRCKEHKAHYLIDLRTKWARRTTFRMEKWEFIQDVLMFLDLTPYNAGRCHYCNLPQEHGHFPGCPWGTLRGKVYRIRAGLPEVG